MISPLFCPFFPSGTRCTLDLCTLSSMTHNFSFIFPFLCLCGILGASLVAQLVKNMPAVQETCVQSLGWEDPLKKEMATHSSILVWEIPWTEERGGLQFMGSQKSWTRLNNQMTTKTSSLFLCRIYCFLFPVHFADFAVQLLYSSLFMLHFPCWIMSFSCAKTMYCFLFVYLLSVILPGKHRA